MASRVKQLAWELLSSIILGVLVAAMARPTVGVKWTPVPQVS
jgi:hypothetical protein